MSHAGNNHTETIVQTIMYIIVSLAFSYGWEQWLQGNIHQV